MKTWLINTNSKVVNGNPNGFAYMLRQSKAAAFYDRATTIDKIQEKDLILLYHNKNRIIAIGFVVKNYIPHDFRDVRHIEHWVDVNWIWKAVFDEKLKPLNPIDRNDVGIRMVNNTVVNVSNQIDCSKLMEEMSKRQTFL
jgi:predicted Mrr-cat superfamily restriction endonuclease